MATANNYSSALRSFKCFLIRDIPFEQFTEQLVINYEQWLFDRGILRNTSSFYLRILRAVYNKAVKQTLVIQSFPFESVYTGVDRTRKRAVGEDVILKLLRLNLSHSYPLALSRDLFVFSYCMRGMSFIDMAYLKKSDITGNTINYVRRKTGQYISVKIEPCARDIIYRYDSTTKNLPYVFPILTSTDAGKAYTQYLVQLGYHNRKLKRLATQLNIDLHLSSYTARHTWATIARNKNIPISIISAGMGHTSEQTTRIYLDSIDNSIIDDANRSILSPLNEILAE